MEFYLKIISIFCSCFFLSANTNAQVRLYAKVYPETVNRNDPFTYKIIVENSANVFSVTPPDLSKFTLLDGPLRANSKATVNGKTVHFTTFEYVLKTKVAGKYRFAPSKAVTPEGLRKSNSSTLVVKDFLADYDPYETKAAGINFTDYILHKNDSIADKINKNIQVNIEVDRKSCYVGEPVVAIYKLYTRLKDRMENVQNPSFNGFSVVDMQAADMDHSLRAQLNGRDFNVFTLRKAQLYPLQPGLISIESAEIETNIQFIREEFVKASGDEPGMYDNYLSSDLPKGAEVTRFVKLESKPVDINVKPLPEVNKPASFKGAVGSFGIAANVQKNLFSTDEAGKLTVTIFGSGNMQLLTPPDISWPAGFEFFDPKVFDKLIGSTVPVSGSKRFEYSFALDDSGQYKIPPINFSFFNPATESYETVSTQPINFRVNKGNGSAFKLSSIGGTSDNSSFLNNLTNYRSWIVIFIGLVMFSGVMIWFVREKRRDKIVSSLPLTNPEDIALQDAVDEAIMNQQNVFTGTEKCLYNDDCAGFYTIINTELKSYLSHKFKVDASGINSDTLSILMDKKEIPNDVALKLQSLMRSIEWQLYTPFERKENLRELYDEAHDTVQMINACV